MLFDLSAYKQAAKHGEEKHKVNQEHVNPVNPVGQGTFIITEGESS